MKKAILPTLLAAAVLAFAPSVFAADQAKPADKPADKQKSCADCKECKCEKGKCACDKKEKPVAITGSHLPQKVRMHGRHADTPSPVVIYSAEDLRATGASDIASALRRLHPSIY
jgi:hypothetical protein